MYWGSILMQYPNVLWKYPNVYVVSYSVLYPDVILSSVNFFNENREQVFDL